MSFIEKIENTLRIDELQGGTLTPLEMRNVKIKSGVSVKRGDIISAATPDGEYSLAKASDTSKNLAVVAVDLADGEDVTQAYTRGDFNIERLNPSAGTDTAIIDALALELRRQNIHLTKMQG